MKSVKCRYAARTGPLLTVAVTNGGERPIGLVKSSLVCDLRQKPGSWLFAMPLASVTDTRLIGGGLNIFDLVGLGHPLDARSTFSIPATLSDTIAQINSRRRASDQKRLRASCDYLLSSLSLGDEELPSGDLYETASRELSPHVEMRFISEEGDLFEVNSPIPVNDLAGFLANYRPDRN